MFFFFKQKTAYEMRISDWSSDVCSSDLKTAEIARATGDAERFTLLLDEYRGAPEVTRKRLWLETVQQVLADNRTIVGDGRQLIYVPMGKAGSASSSAPPLLTPDMVAPTVNADNDSRSEEHTSELQSLMRTSYAVFCLKKKKNTTTVHQNESY